MHAAGRGGRQALDSEHLDDHPGEPLCLGVGRSRERVFESVNPVVALGAGVESPCLPDVLDAPDPTFHRSAGFSTRNQLATASGIVPAMLAPTITTTPYSCKPARTTSCCTTQP